MINQYPLAWPAGWKRTQIPEQSKFKPGSVYSESLDVSHQLKRMNASDIVISSNMRYRQDGLPYAQQGYIADVGVAVYFKLNGEEQCIPCDKWSRVEDNIRAVSKTIEALRGIERWGAKEMVNAAFRGFQALPSSITVPHPSDRPHRAWNVVLGVEIGASAQDVKQAYRKAQALAHPDAGGSDQDFQEVQAAYQEWKEL